MSRRLGPERSSLRPRDSRRGVERRRSLERGSSVEPARTGDGVTRSTATGVGVGVRRSCAGTRSRVCGGGSEPDVTITGPATAVVAITPTVAAFVTNAPPAPAPVTNSAIRSAVGAAAPLEPADAAHPASGIGTTPSPPRAA